MKCPRCDREGDHTRNLAPNEEWCTSCDSILEQMPDGTVRRWSGVQLMIEREYP